MGGDGASSTGKNAAKAVGKKFVNPMAEMVVAGGEEAIVVGATQGQKLGKASISAAAKGGAAAISGVQETAKSSTNKVSLGRTDTRLCLPFPNRFCLFLLPSWELSLLPFLGAP